MERRELLSAAAALGALATVGVDRGEAGTDSDDGRAGVHPESDTVEIDVVLTDE